MTFSPRAIEAAARAIYDLPLQDGDAFGTLIYMSDYIQPSSRDDMQRQSIKLMEEIVRAALSAALAVDGVALQGWQPIETFPEDYPHWSSEYDTKATKTKYYEPALVFGATWEGRNDWPTDGGGDWTGPARIAIATTYEGKGFWTVESDAPNDYDTHVRPTHWMPLPQPPAASDREERR
jgi:hypothetical protein